MIDRKRELLSAAAALCIGNLLLGGALYADRAMDYRDRFIPGTVINGIEVQEMGVQEVEDLLSVYDLRVHFRSGSDTVIKGEQIGFRYRSDGRIQQILEGQNLLLWLPGRYRKTEYTIETPKEYSQVKLSEVMDLIPQLEKEGMTEPEDAFMDYRDGEFVVVPEIEGTTLDVQTARFLIEDAVRREETELDLASAEGLYEEPEVRSDDEFLCEQTEILNDIAGADITYTMPDHSTVRLDGPFLLSWLEQDEDGFYYRDDDEWEQYIYEFVYGMADDLDTVYKDHEFVTHDGRKIMVPGVGYYGWHLDKNAEIEELTEELYDNEEIEREPNFKRREAAAPGDNHGFGDDYCEIDLTAQHLWIYKEGTAVFDTPVVSGNNDEDCRTPAGAYFAYDKKTETVLRGDKQEDGSWGYETEVDYWIRITQDGIGLHDASWRRSFGGNIWKWNGSHGCINLPVAAAPIIYDYLEEGTPVVVYY